MHTPCFFPFTLCKCLSRCILYAIISLALYLSFAPLLILERFLSLLLHILKCKVLFYFCRRMLSIIFTCGFGHCLSTTIHFYFVLSYPLSITIDAKEGSLLSALNSTSMSLNVHPYISFSSLWLARFHSALFTLVRMRNVPLHTYCYNTIYHYTCQYYYQIGEEYLACIKESTGGPRITLSHSMLFYYNEMP